MVDKAKVDALGANLSDPEDDEESPPLAAKSVKPRKKKSAVVAKAAEGMGDRVWIVLEENEDIPPTGLFLQHNGDPCLLMPGVPAHVQRRYLNILNDAVMSMPTIDPQTKQVIGYRDRLRYNYREVSAPSGG